MMDFIVSTLSFTVAILLAMVLAFMVMLSPKVMKWYMKFIVKRMKQMDDLIDMELKDEEL